MSDTIIDTPVPSVSVVIPAYNEASLIAKCLDALSHQTVSPHEIIIVDNNSRDKTVAIAGRYKNVKVIAEKRQGISYARSTGFDAASGTVIARIDADSIVAPNWIERLGTYFQSPDIAAVAGAAAIVELSAPQHFWGKLYYQFFRYWHERSLEVRPIMYGYNCALKTTAWQTVRADTSLDDADLSEDLDLTILLQKDGLKVVYASDVIVKCHVLRSFNISKMKNYYRRDGYTLKKHSYGNKSRWLPK